MPGFVEERQTENNLRKENKFSSYNLQGHFASLPIYWSAL